MAGVICSSCKQSFDGSILLKDHYRSEWHRYNVQLKIRGISHVDFDVFELKNLTNKPTRYEKKIFACKICSKNFSTENALLNHEKSKKHIKNQKDFDINARESKRNKKRSCIDNIISSKMSKLSIHSSCSSCDSLRSSTFCSPDDSDSSDWISDEDSITDLTKNNQFSNHCLFCSKKYDQLSFLIKHMTRMHSFFIPDNPYLFDINGLIKHLYQRIKVENVCIYCGVKSKFFANVNDCQQHMREKGHCMLNVEDLENIYYIHYDYTSSYPAEMDGDPTQKSSHASNLIVDPDTFDLITPSGNRIGHRSLRVYFNQYLSAQSDDTYHNCIPIKCHDQLLPLFSARTGFSHVVTTRSRSIFRDRASEVRKNKAFDLLNGLNSNKLQKYFRCQNPK
ncbi:hypothetical protein HZS_1201 [Henneguya salminicola]|nr:hypothetical protein HZS_1201 [Henneguya salminicola]